MRHCLYIFLLMFISYSCDNIAEDDRFIEIPKATINKAVLLVDFTGQKCNNCPFAAEAVKLLKEQYGEQLIAVSMHGGKLAVPVSKGGLKTEIGDEYVNFFGIEKLGYPTALIDGKEKVNVYETWPNIVRDFLKNTTPVDLALSVDFEDGLLKVSSKIEALEDVTDLKLQLWILENNVIGPQIMPNQTDNSSYQHEHVFRDVLNGTWGEDVIIRKGEETLLTSAKYALNEKWVTENITVVGFLYNAQTKEVYQTKEISIK